MVVSVDIAAVGAAAPVAITSSLVAVATRRAAWLPLWRSAPGSLYLLRDEHEERPIWIGARLVGAASGTLEFKLQHTDFATEEMDDISNTPTEGRGRSIIRRDLIEAFGYLTVGDARQKSPVRTVFQLLPSY